MFCPRCQSNNLLLDYDEYKCISCSYTLPLSCTVVKSLEESRRLINANLSASRRSGAKKLRRV